MNRTTAREIAVHMAYALDFSPDLKELVESRTDCDFYSELSDEDPIFAKPPGDEQCRYIKTLTEGIEHHLPEIDGYIEKYTTGWKFGRLPRVAIAVMRVCIYEVLYCPDIPKAASINSAIDIAKKYEPAQVCSFINGILGTFVRQEVDHLDK